MDQSAVCMVPWPHSSWTFIWPTDFCFLPWGQTILYLFDPMELKKDQIIEGSVTLSQSIENVRFLNINIQYWWVPQPLHIDIDRLYIFLIVLSWTPVFVLMPVVEVDLLLNSLLCDDRETLVLCDSATFVFDWSDLTVNRQLLHSWLEN